MAQPTTAISAMDSILGGSKLSYNFDFLIMVTIAHKSYCEINKSSDVLTQWPILKIC